VNVIIITKVTLVANSLVGGGQFNLQMQRQFITSHLGFSSSSGVWTMPRGSSASGEGEVGLSRPPEKSTDNKSGLFFPPLVPRALRAHERSTKTLLS